MLDKSSTSLVAAGELDWVDNGLAVGGRADATDEFILRRNAIDAILCVESECPDYPPLRGLVAAHFGFEENGELSERNLMSCLATIDKWLGMGRTVLLHCGAGISRAPLIATAYLAWRYHVPWSTAENLVRFKHPPAMPHPRLVGQAREYLNRWEFSAT